MSDIKEVIPETLEDPISLRDIIVKSEGLRIGFVVFSSIIAFLVLLPVFFNNSALKFHLAQKMSQVSGANVAIYGDVKVAFLPSPSITAEKILIQNFKLKKPIKVKKEGESDVEKIYNLYAKSVVFELPFFHFSDSVFKQIIFDKVILETHNSSDLNIEREDQFTTVVNAFEKKKLPEEDATEDAKKEDTKEPESGISYALFSIDDFNENSLLPKNMPDIIFTNAEAVIYDKLGRKREIGGINFEVDVSENKIFLEGIFNSEGVLSTVKLLAKFDSKSSSDDSFFEITSPIMNFRIDGKFSLENRGILASDFKGKIGAEIFDLKSFYKSYVGGNSAIANKIKYSTNSIKISADIDSHDREFIVQNMVLNSSLVSGKGEVEFSFANEVPVIDVNLDLENFDLDGIWSGDVVSTPFAEARINRIPDCPDDMVVLPSQDQKVAEAKKEEKLSPKKIEPINFNFTQKIKDLDITAEIKIKDTKYLEGNIKDTNLYLTVSSNGEILVLPMIFRIPGEGLFRVNGVLDNTTDLPKFVGKFDIVGKSLKDVVNWMQIESQNLKFDNLKSYSVYSDVLLMPNKTIFDNFYLNLNNGQSEFFGEIHVDNSEKIPNISSIFRVNNFKVDDYFLISAQNAYFGSGLLIRKLLWLNSILSNNSLELSFDKLIYKDEEFVNQSMAVKFKRGYFEIANLNLKSDKTDLLANLSIDVSDQNPKFDIDVNAKKFQYNVAQKSKTSVGNSDGTKGKKQNIIDQFFSLPSLEGFNGGVSLKFDDLIIDDIEVQDFKMLGKIADGNIKNSNVSLNLYDGSLVYKGFIGLKISKTINGNLTFDEVDLQPLFSNLFDVDGISGVANISASVTSIARTKEEFAKNLRSDVKFSANAPSIEGYGLGELVRKMFDPKTYRGELSNPDKILFNSAAKTIFKQANGVLQTVGGEGKIRINASAPAVNGILSGTISIPNNSMDALFNTIFLTGTRQKQSHINIATVFKGKINAPAYSSNYDQVKQYLGFPVEKKAATTNIAPKSTADSANQDEVQKATTLEPPIKTPPTQNQQSLPEKSPQPFPIQ
jgi:predicted RNA-binding protein